MDNPKITITRDAGQPGTGKMTQAKAGADALRQEVQNRRKQIHDQAKIDALGASDSPFLTQDPVEAPERENLESIEFTLPDGRQIEYGPPSGISLSDRIARLFSARPLSEGGPDPGITEFRLCKLLMGVRSIDGKPVRPITNLVEKTRLANLLGDPAIDLLSLFDSRHWPPLRESELPVLKKNLRQS